MPAVKRDRTPPIESETETKRERTRREVLRAALECVAENGTAGATASEIARRCGLSWGVIQYHFGDRVGLLIALLESGLATLSKRLDSVQAAEGKSQIRVRRLIAETWSLLRADNYRVMLDVQLQLGRLEDQRARVREVTRRLRSQLQMQWRKSLPELPPSLVDRAERLATVTLRGLALERALGDSRSEHDQEIECLLQCLFGILDLK